MWTVGLAAGAWDSMATRLAGEIAIILTDGDNLRVIPMVTSGTDANLIDLIYLRGVDAAIIPADTLNRVKTDKTIAHVDRRINYVAPLVASPIYILARAGNRSLDDLRGKTVSVDLTGSAASTSAKAIFDALGISVNAVNLATAVAFEKVKSGEIDALVYVTTPPDPFLASIGQNDNVVLLAIPNSEKFKDLYDPVTLKSADYPNLVASGSEITTLSIPMVLAVFGFSDASDRNARVRRFVEAFIKRLDDLKKPPFHPQWKAVDLTASVAGWTRYPVVQDYITRLQAALPAATSASSPGEVNNDAATKILGQFFVFLAQREKTSSKRGGDEDFDKIMKDFLVWRAAQK
jgi:TRAP-type uncharacterized transport system substrate-binding protein